MCDQTSSTVLTPELLLLVTWIQNLDYLNVLCNVACSVVKNNKQFSDFSELLQLSGPLEEYRNGKWCEDSQSAGMDWQQNYTKSYMYKLISNRCVSHRVIWRFWNRVIYGKYMGHLDSGLEIVYKFCPAKRIRHLKEVAKTFKEMYGNIYYLRNKRRITSKGGAVCGLV